MMKSVRPTVLHALEGMKMLSPAEEPSHEPGAEQRYEGHRVMPRYYMFITLIMHVKLEASIASLLANIMENKQVTLIDHDEVARRVVIRAPVKEAAYIQLLVNHYADTASFEVKASARGKVEPKTLRESVDAYTRLGDRILFYRKCREGAVFGEVRKRNMLLKYCKNATLVDPAALPPILCSFDAKTIDIVEVAEKARKCFDEMVQLVS